MSKFFNNTQKNRGPIFPAEELDLQLPPQEIGAIGPSLNLEDFSSVADEGEASSIFSATAAETLPSTTDGLKKVEIPRTSQLVSQFQGCHTLQAAEESYRALRTRLLRLRSSRELRSVVITSAAPCEGKTLTSFNLALSCSQLEDMRILLVDGDFRTSGLSRFLGSSTLLGLSDVLSKEDCPPESSVVETDQPNLFFCSAGLTTQPPPELYASRRWHDFMDWCHESFQLVVIDSPPVISLADVELITAACDGSLLVVRARQTSREALQKAGTQLDPKKFIGLVYNVSEGPFHKYYYGGGKN